MAVGAAASVLLLVGASNLGILGSLIRRPALAAVQGDHQLASAWIATRTEFPIHGAGAWEADESLPLADDETFAATETNFAVEELMSVDTPSWMTAALLAQAGIRGDELPVERLEN